MSNDIDWLIEAHYHDVISNAEVEFDAAYLLNLFPAAIYVLYGWIPAQGPWHHIRAGIAHRKDTEPAFMIYTAHNIIITAGD